MSEALVAYGLDDRVATLFDSFELPPACAAAGEPYLTRVARVDRTSLLAVADGGLRRLDAGGVWSRRAACPEVATGDWVAAIDVPGSLPQAVGVLPRRSALTRRTPEDRSRADQVLAANVDVLGVVAPLDRPPSPNRVDRMLVLAWESGARPVVVLTKSDVAGDLEAVLAATEEAARGVPVLVTSATSGDGTAELSALVREGGTLALIGPSGAGKSSLVNAISGGERQRTGLVREADGRGRQTTTSRELVPVPGGGVLLDTPGLRSLGLLDAEAGISATFGDVEELAAACRFGDCSHVREPGCAVLAAIEDGRLERRRLESYGKLMRELAREERRQLGPAGRAARREHREHWAAVRRHAAPPRMDERRQRGR